MGLANICSLLIQRGYRVGVMDLDLEAPGLDTISPFNKDADTSLGVLGFLSDIQAERCAIGDVEQYGRKIDILDCGPLFFLRSGT